MAGTVTVLEERQGRPEKVRWDWTSDGDGDADLQTAHPYWGAIIRLVTIPSSGAAPSDNYDVAVLDEDGADVLMGAGANRHTSNTQQVAASSLGCVAGDRLNLSISNAGDAKSGTVILYIG